MGASRSLSSILAAVTGRAWRRRLSGRTFLAFGYFVAVVLWVATVIMSAKAPGQGPLAPTRQILLALLVPNLLLIAFLAGTQAWAIVRLIQEQARDAGARLHLKFVGMFALAAFLPALVVLVFFGALVSRGVDNWFSKRVSTVV